MGEPEKGGNQPTLPRGYELNNLSKSSSTLAEASVVTISGSLLSSLPPSLSDGFKKLDKCSFNSSKVGSLYNSLMSGCSSSNFSNTLLSSESGV